jgi:ABC-type uncharacterized transport system permease subunit
MTLLLCLGASLLFGLAALRLWQGLPHRWPAAAALLLQTLALGGLLFVDGGLAIGWASALTLFTWQSALLLWALSLNQPPLQSLGLAAYPLAAAGALIGALAPPGGVQVSGSALVSTHVLLSLLSGGLLTLAAVQAVLLAIQERRLHRHDAPPLMQRLPPLLAMERALFQLIGIGFILLSASLLTGFGFIKDWLAQHLAHKTVLSVSAWLIFGGLLLGRWRVGLRGRQATRWALIGYGVLLLGYFGSKFVLEALLGAHWRAG